MSWDPFIKLVGDTGPTGSFQFNGATNSILFFDGNQVTGTTEFTYIPGPSGSVSLQGDFLPTQDAIYNLGSTGLRWGEIHVGHGTINIAGPSGSSAVGTIGTDANSIVYTKNGFASPFINIGPSIDPLDPGAIGGWVVGPTGTFGQDDYDLIAQQKLEGQAFPAGVTGPIYSLIKRVGPTGDTGSTGDTGHTGHTGPQDIPSAFSGTNQGFTGISLSNSGPTGATLISSCYIITSNTGYIWLTSSAEFSSIETKIIDIGMYVVINGISSNTTLSSIASKGSGNLTSYTQLTVHQRTTSKLPPGGYTGSVYAYTIESAPTVRNTHCDTFALGNLT